MGWVAVVVHIDGLIDRRRPRPGLSLLSATTIVLAFSHQFAFAEDGFSINVDGQHVAGDPVAARLATQAKTDLALQQANVRVTFDGLGAIPRLSAVASTEGKFVTFSAASNYPHWIARSEILIYVQQNGPAFGRQIRQKQLAVLPLSINGDVTWERAESDQDQAEQELSYVLRVYDVSGRFDETARTALPRNAIAQTSLDSDGVVVIDDLAVESVLPDQAVVRNIPVEGGAVTVHGGSIPDGHSVSVLGEVVPVGSNGAFVVERILPFGEHQIDVEIADGVKSDVTFARNINIPQAEWFGVALADLTLGKRFASNAIEAADPERYKNVYSKGRLAFYLKGRIKGSVLLTAAADTGEGKLSTLFQGLDEKDPRQLLRRIDPDDYYPVYGDDSKSIEDAPTSGKFYVRLENKNSHVMWGNFKSRIEGNALLRNERALYGAQGVYKSEQLTTHGASRLEASAYGAQPGTLPQRDVLRGTGGSVYFLKRQDITRGSETVTVVISDPASQRVLSRRTLVAGQDYTVDYTQGIILLTAPLSSSAAGSSGAVRENATGAADASLAVNYEYTPGLAAVDGFSYGGRVQAWVNDAVRIGATGMNETTGGADQQMMGADIRLRKTENTYVELDYAKSKGPGFGRSVSTDGGLTLTDVASAGTIKNAEAIKVRAVAALSDFNPRWNGTVSAFYEQYEAGFTTLDQSFEFGQTEWGMAVDAALTDQLSARLAFNSFQKANGTDKVKADAELSYKPNDQWRIVLGAAYVDLNTPAAKTPENGLRTDLGLRVEYRPNDETLLYAFGQVTAARKGAIRRNDRGGIGAKVKLNEKFGLEAEVSEGTTGLGALAKLTYDRDSDHHAYIGYKLDPDRSFDRTDNISLSGVDLGGLVLGSRVKFNEEFTTFTENTYDMFGRRRSLASTYGVTYTPDDYWTTSAGLELGRIIDPHASDFDRYAPSLSIAYQDKGGLTARLKAEARFERSEDKTRNRDTFMLSAGYANTLNPNWRVSFNADAVISQSDQATILDGDYVEASLGFAYRPIENDRLNALFKYTFLYDFPGPNQVARGTGTLLGPAQRSQILSADFVYDLNDYLSIGAKYGFRYGEVSATRSPTNFIPSSAHLGVLRADAQVFDQWDLLLEGRIMHLPEAKTTRLGALAAVYYHVSDNMKAGVGYNFGQFSDDLTDLTYDDKGVFLNVVGKY